VNSVVTIIAAPSARVNTPSQVRVDGAAVNRVFDVAGAARDVALTPEIAVRDTIATATITAD
jgi:hypothetical protein